jgi:hypothetical protein
MTIRLRNNTRKAIHLHIASRGDVVLPPREWYPAVGDRGLPLSDLEGNDQIRHLRLAGDVDTQGLEVIAPPAIVHHAPVPRAIEFEAAAPAPKKSKE